MSKVPRPVRIKVVPLIGGDPGVAGQYRPRQREILLKEGHVSGGVLGHELGHMVLEHDLGVSSVRAFVSEEIDAYVWAYGKSKQPVHMKKVLRGIINDGMDIFNAPPLVTWGLLHQKLKKTRGVPRTWLQDLRDLKREAKEAEE